LYPIGGIVTGYGLIRETHDKLQNVLLESQRKNNVELSNNHTIIENVLNKNNDNILSEILTLDLKLTEFLLDPNIANSIREGFEFIPSL
jgi:hypothetical protein